MAIKFWNYRHFWVKGLGADTYRCPWDNGVFEPSQINWAIPNFSYQDIVGRIRVPGGASAGRHWSLHQAKS